MAKYYVGEFNLLAGGGNQSITGVGFKPKLVVAMLTRMTAIGVTGSLSMSYGFADENANQAGVFMSARNGVGTSVTGRIGSAASFILSATIAAPTVLDTEASLTSMDADGFTINITTGPGGAYRVVFMAIGGNDFNAEVGSVLLANPSGNSTVTGLAFQPDSLLTCGAFLTGVSTNGAQAVQSIGFASGLNNQAATGFYSQNNVLTSNSQRQQLEDYILNIVAAGVSYQVELTSFTADGFTVAASGSLATNATYMYFAAMKGIPTHVGAFNSRTAAGDFSISGAGFRPGAGIFASFLNAASASIIDSLQASYGVAVDTTHRGCIGGSDEDNQGTTDTDSWNDNVTLYQNYDFARNLEGEIDFVSWDWDGFTLDQVDADPTANEIIYMVFKDVDEPDAPDRIIRTRSIPLSIPSSPNPEGLYNPPQQQTLEKVSTLERRFDNLLTGVPRFLVLGDNEPDQITANQNNYDPGDNTVLWLSSDAARTITGFSNGSRGRVLIVVNVGSFQITMNYNDASSDAPNRVLTDTGANAAIAANGWALMIYNINENRWRLFDL